MMASPPTEQLRKVLQVSVGFICAIALRSVRRHTVMSISEEETEAHGLPPGNPSTALKLANGRERI